MSNKVVFFLSTDKYSSPFDILILYDGGADVVVPCNNVSLEDTGSLVMDAMFPRGPKGIRDTTVFIGGKDIVKCEEILKLVKKTMFPPFEIAVAFDPAGSCTTSAALVAKVAQMTKVKLNSALSELKVVVLAGAGNVGSRAVHLFAKEGASVVIADVAVDLANKVAKKVNENIGADRVKVASLRGSDFVVHDLRVKDVVYSACEDADIVVSTGPPKVTTLTKDILSKFSKCKIVADINAVSPEGIEGIKATADGDEILPGIISIGPLSIGNVKLQTELKLVKEAINSKNGIFGYEEAFNFAKEIVGL